jgi:hypothetical protein
MKRRVSRTKPYYRLEYASNCGYSVAMYSVVGCYVSVRIEPFCNQKGHGADLDTVLDSLGICRYFLSVLCQMRPFLN